jgi:two-component system sensor histidine kinase BarA
MKILVVDDSAEQRDLFATLIRSAGHDVIEAPSGAVALSIAAGLPDCDLVMMDARMPDMDGMETTRRLRDLGGRWLTVPIIAMSTADAKGWHDAGADDFFDKSGGSQGLLRLLRAIKQQPSPPTAEPDGFFIPRMALIGLVLTVPALIGSGSWYLSHEAGQAEQLADAVKLARAELTVQQGKQDAEIHNNETAIAQLLASRNEVINAMDQRVTRAEAQIVFMLADERDRRGVVEAQLKYLADNLRVRR